MNLVELKKVSNPHEYWPQQCGFSEGVNSYEEFEKAIEWFRKNSATFAHVAFRGESKYYKTFCKPNITRNTRKFTKTFSDENIITDQEIKSALLNSGNHTGNNIFFNTQHYGGQTRLIDVTTSEQVALFFACESNFNDDGYVYISFASTMASLWAPEAKDIDSILTFYNFIGRNDVCYLLETFEDQPARMKAQFGAFLCWQDITKPLPGPQYTIRIKHSAKKRILNEISKFGWKPEKLFPDLYGIWLKENLNSS